MEPKVSICMITYNHEKYIAQAIESVLMQKVNFPTELVIGEDFSTDNTRKICLSFKEKYPDIIKLRLPDKNLRTMTNFIENIEFCKGQYIAMLDGDDYWTNPLKLQKQVDFLEANPDYVMCFHNVKLEKDTGEIGYLSDQYKVERDTYMFEDFCPNNPIAHTSSLIFRNMLKKLPPMLHKCSIGDWPLKVLISEHGKSKYLDEVMSCYRFHSDGTWNGGGIENSEKIIKTRRILNKYYKGKYRAYFEHPNKRRVMLIFYYDAFSYSCQSRHFLKAFYYAFKVIMALKFSHKNPYTITRIGTVKRLLVAFVSPKTMNYTK